MDDKTTPNIMKYAYSWVTIMLCINVLYVGYIVTGGIDPLTVSEDSLYSIFAEQESGAQTSIGSLNNINENYDVGDLTSTGSQSGTILDALDQLWAFGRWTWFAVKFITLGGVFTGLSIVNLIQNSFLSFVVSAFMIIGNVIFIFLVYKFIMNKGRFE